MSIKIKQLGYLFLTLITLMVIASLVQITFAHASDNPSTDPHLAEHSYNPSLIWSSNLTSGMRIEPTTLLIINARLSRTSTVFINGCEIPNFSIVSTGVVEIPVSTCFEALFEGLNSIDITFRQQEYDRIFMSLRICSNLFDDAESECTVPSDQTIYFID